MRKLTLFYILSIFLILTVNATASTEHGTRIQELVIEKGVSRSIGKSLELVTFAPGSGWLRLNDTLTPVVFFSRVPQRLNYTHSALISFNSVTQEDIQKFNRFAESIGYPFRVKLAGNVLHIQHIRNRILGTESAIDMRATQKRGFFKVKERPRMVLSRQKSGKILLAAAKDSPETAANLLALQRAIQHRRAGFKMTQKGFAALAASPDLNETVVLKNVTVRIVGHIKAYNKEAASYGDGVLGYATAKNEITVLGKRVGDQIVVNQAVLGHELKHLLNYQDSKMVDPDNLDYLGK